MKKITMKDIANLSGVSQATVSRVINGNTNVNKEVIERVNSVIKESGYVPNKAAQTLKNNSSKILGVSVTDIYNPYFVELIATIEQESRKKGYSILLHNANLNPLIESENIDNFIARQVDGFIFVPTSDYNIAKIKDCNIPNVAISLLVNDLDSVSLDHVEGGALAAKHFITRGHTKFAAIAESGDDKLIGYINEIQDHGFDIKDSNIIHLESAHTVYQIKSELVKLIEQKKDDLDFTAIFCINDSQANEFIKIIEKQGYRVPEDIAVIGFDDTYISKVNSITSVSQPMEDMVKNTIEILIDKIENDNVDRQAVHIQLSPIVVPRRSTREL